MTFQIMDAARMSYPDNTFDTVVIYNAFFHIRDQWDEIEKECRRVLKTHGNPVCDRDMELDTILMIEMFGDQAFWQAGFCSSGSKRNKLIPVLQKSPVKSSDLQIAPKNKLAAQQRGCEFERRKTFAVEMSTLVWSSDIQRSFLRGTPDTIRTCDLQSRSLSLYPTELRAHL